MKALPFILCLTSLFLLSACEKELFKTPEELIVGQWQITTYESEPGKNLVLDNSDIRWEMEFHLDSDKNAIWYVALTDKKTGGQQSAAHYGTYTLTNGYMAITFPQKNATIRGNLDVSDAEMSIKGQIVDKNGGFLPLTMKAIRK